MQALQNTLPHMQKKAWRKGTGNQVLTMVEKHRIIKKFSKDYNRTGKKGREEIPGIIVFLPLSIKTIIFDKFIYQRQNC